MPLTQPVFVLCNVTFMVTPMLLLFALFYKGYASVDSCELRDGECPVCPDNAGKLSGGSLFWMSSHLTIEQNVNEKA